MTESGGMKRQLKIFKAEDSTTVDDERMAPAGITPEIGAGLNQIIEAGNLDGFLIRHLFSDPVSGMSLVYVWLKSGYQLPIHSHHADCLYYVMSGEAIMGTEVLTVGDGFFVPSGARYSYRAGDNGTEVLECRNATHFDINFTGTGPNMMARIAELSRAKAETWRSQSLPVAVRRFKRVG